MSISLGRAREVGRLLFLGMIVGKDREAAANKFIDDILDAAAEQAREQFDEAFKNLARAAVRDAIAKEFATPCPTKPD